MFSEFFLTPTFNKDYDNKIDLLKDWYLGKNFSQEPLGQLISIKDVPMPCRIVFRYDRRRRCTIINENGVD